MRPRTLFLACAALVLTVTFSVQSAVRTAPQRQFSAASLDPPASLQVFYTPPVLVEAGQPVRIPVDAVCSTVDGNPCPANVTLGTQVEGDPWSLTAGTARRGLEFDATEEASDAVGSSVRFFIQAWNDAGPSRSLGTQQTPLRFWVTDEIHKSRMPSLPFGKVRKPTIVLSLPWGSGPAKAGLTLGNEAPTLGPSSFDVGRGGAIALLDSQQDRLAVFAGGMLKREISLPLGEDADVAATPKGSFFLLNPLDDTATVRRIDASGDISAPVAVGEALSSHIEALGETGEVNLLPLDAWLPAPETPSPAPPQLETQMSVGRPVGSDIQLLRVASENTVRLGLASGDVVSHAVEIQSDVPLGEVALADTDGRGGYWCVVHVWQEEPSAADQYQVMHVTDAGIDVGFAVEDENYAETPPLSRFRLSDGALYQLSTTKSGARILRYELGEEA